MADSDRLIPLSAPSAPERERRATARRPFLLDVFYQPVDEDSAGLWPARLENLSAHGIGLIVTRPFEKGASLAVELAPEETPLPAALLVKVIWSEPLDESNWYLGCSLANPVGVEELVNLL